MIPQHGTLEISRGRLRNNLNIFRDAIGPTANLCPVIKANAYGHDLKLMQALLQGSGVTWLSVYSLEEAAACAIAGKGQFRILALAPMVLTDASLEGRGPLDTLIEPYSRHIRVNVTDLQSARRLSQAVVTSTNRNGIGAKRITLNIHVQVDTGLTRVGVDPQHASALCGEIALLPGLFLEGLFSHLSHGDTPGDPTLQQQFELFHQIATPLKQKFPHLLLHLQNSGGLFNLPIAPPNNLDMVRIGIALYGLQPSTQYPIPHLQPIARLTAPILAIHDRPPGTGVGYGHTFVTTRPSRLAIVPVGYADGYPRQRSNAPSAIAQLRGVDFPVVGRVSMDQIILDITDLPGPPAQPGEIVTVISNDPAKANSLDAMAAAIGTIGYELATHLGQRLRRIIVD